MLVNIKDYREAEQIVKDYKICGNTIAGCEEVFKTEDLTKTIQYGQVYYWCSKCYSVIGD